MTSTDLTRQRLALVVVCAATLMTVIDETVVAVALPSIEHDLGFARSQLPWVVNAYLIGFGGLLLVAGRVGDLVGRGRVLLVGMSVFTLASVLCGLAQDPTWLVAARFVQGAAGALATAVALGMVAALFDEPAARDRAMGTYAFMGALGASTGFVLGGVITSALDWRWAFLVNLPIGVLVVAIGLRVLPRESGPGLRGGVDWLGGALLVVGLMTLVAAILDSSLVLAVVATASLVGFGARQGVAEVPVLPLEVFRSRVMTVANLAFACFVGAMFTFQFTVTLHLQEVMGLGPAQAGLGILPIAAGLAVVATLVFPRVVGRFGTMTPMVAGLTLVTAGLALLTRATADGSYVTDLLPSVVLFAVGGGLTLPAMMTTAMSAAPAQHVGVASGLLNTSQQAGGAVGLAVMSAVAAHVSAGALADGASRADALVDGFRVAWAGAAGLAAVALVLAAVGLRRPAVAASPDPVSCGRSD